MYLGGRSRNRALAAKVQHRHDICRCDSLRLRDCRISTPRFSGHNRLPNYAVATRPVSQHGARKETIRLPGFAHYFKILMGDVE